MASDLSRPVRTAARFAPVPRQIRAPTRGTLALPWLDQKPGRRHLAALVVGQVATSRPNLMVEPVSREIAPVSLGVQVLSLVPVDPAAVFDEEDLQLTDGPGQAVRPPSLDGSSVVL
jgi:hypothetical protein